MSGEIKPGDDVLYGKPNADGEYKKGRIVDVFVFNHIGREKVTSALAGDIVTVSGIADISIGDTIMDKQNPSPLPAIIVEEPTVCLCH